MSLLVACWWTTCASVASAGSIVQWQGLGENDGDGVAKHDEIATKGMTTNTLEVDAGSRVWTPGVDLHRST